MDNSEISFDYLKQLVKDLKKDGYEYRRIQDQFDKGYTLVSPDPKIQEYAKILAQIRKRKIVPLELTSDTTGQFILDQIAKVGLGHSEGIKTIMDFEDLIYDYKEKNGTDKLPITLIVNVPSKMWRDAPNEFSPLANEIRGLVESNGVNISLLTPNIDYLHHEVIRNCSPIHPQTTL